MKNLASTILIGLAACFLGATWVVIYAFLPVSKQPLANTMAFLIVVISTVITLSFLDARERYQHRLGKATRVTYPVGLPNWQLSTVTLNGYKAAVSSAPSPLFRSLSEKEDFYQGLKFGGTVAVVVPRVSGRIQRTGTLRAYQEELMQHNSSSPEEKFAQIVAFNSRVLSEIHI